MSGEVPLPDLRSNAFLRVLPAEVRRELEARCARKRLPDGARVLERGGPADGLYGIVRGRVRVMGVAPGGREAVLTYLEPGQWFGEISLLDGLPRTHDAWTVGETELLLLPRRDFRAVLDAQPGLYRHLAVLLCHRLRMVFAAFEDSLTLDLGGRLARRLLGLVDDHGEPAPGGVRIALRLPQEELGRMVGATREAVGRHLKAWERRGWIRVEYGRVVVCDREALSELGAAAPAEGW